jgi:hypothetical protein
MLAVTDDHLRAAPRHSLAQLRRSITVVAAAQPPLRFDDGAHGAVCEWYETSKWLRLIRKNGLHIAVRPKTFMKGYRRSPPHVLQNA